MTAVSIIIPTFNRAGFLGPAIDSALAQGPGTEVIVVDDGSTDDTEALLGAYGGQIRALRQTNAGPSVARNFGAREALGDYLFFLDSDDLLEPGAIDRLLLRARALGPDRIAFGAAITIDADGQCCAGPTYGFPNAVVGAEVPLATLLGGTMPLCLCLIPARAFHSAGGLRLDLALGEDQELAVRLHAAGLRYVATGEPVVRVRLHGGPRLSGIANPDFGARAVKLWTLVSTAARGAGDFSPAARRALASVIWTSARGAARAADRANAQHLFALARSLDTSVGHAGPVPLRTLGSALGPYRAERAMELAKRLLRRS